MRGDISITTVLFISGVCFISLPNWSATQQVNLTLNLPTNVPNNQTLVSLKDVPDIEKRSDEGSDAAGRHSLFKSIIPRSPFKTPIKSLFRSWFEPNPEALAEESKVSTFYFAKPQKALFRSISPSSFLFNKKLTAESSVPYLTYASPTGIVSPSTFTYHKNALPKSQQRAFQTPTFAFGDPENGRGITLSMGSGSKPDHESAPSQSYPQSSNAAPSGGGLSLSLGGSGKSGMSFNLGGRGAGGSDASSGGSGDGGGFSFSLGGGDGGGRGGRGMSLSLGGKGGGSGLSFSLGGGSGASADTKSNTYQPSSSSNYPVASSMHGSNYGPSYGSSYGSNNYGSNYNYNYKQKPKFSITMPSMGKTVIEANLRPSPIKLKMNASPKVKVTTGTRDPLEKPSLEEEVIIEDIFGPPAPFEKKNKTLESNGTQAGSNQTGLNGTEHMYPYPYPPYSYPGYSGYPNYAGYAGYPGYQHHPYNYYYNYYQQYPYPSQPPGYSYATSGSSNIVTHIDNSAKSKNPKSEPIQSTFPKSHSSQFQSGIINQRYKTRESPSTPLAYIDNNSISHKRSSASRNYHKDMLTLGSNAIETSVSIKEQNTKSHKSPHKDHYYYDSAGKQEAMPSNYYSVQQQPQKQPQTQPGSIAQQSQGTGAGYSYYRNAANYPATSPAYYNAYPMTAIQSLPGSKVSYPSYYSDPYFYYKDYFNYAKKYYESYYANHSTSAYPAHAYNKTKKSISGFNQQSLDYHQSKVFGSKVEKYNGPSIKEEKSRIVFDIRPRVTFKALNKTEQMQQEHELKNKKKDHIFNTKLTILMDTTTAKPPVSYNHGNSYGYEDDDNFDEFGYAYAPTIPPSVTPKPIVTTTTRRRTTTEAGTSQEGSEEETTNDSTSESAEEDSPTTTTTETPEMDSNEESENTSKESTTSTTTEKSATEEGDEVIDGNEVPKDEAKEEIENKEEDTSEKSNEDTDEAEKETTISTTPASASIAKSVTVSPELVSVMVKALQEALGVTSIPLTTPSPVISTLTSLNEDKPDENDLDEDKSTEGEDVIETTSDDIEKEKESDNEDEEDEETVNKSKTSEKNKTKLIPTVYRTNVDNVTQLRLKTPVLSVQPRIAEASNIVKHRTSLSSRNNKIKKKDSNSFEKKEETENEVTTTSPFIMSVSKKGKNKGNEVDKVIDGNAVLSNFNVDDLTDGERRDMLTNILSIIHNKSNNSDQFTSQKSRSKSKTKLLPITKASNVRIISSLDELNADQSNKSGTSKNQPVYVILLPQNKKKK